MSQTFTVITSQEPDPVAMAWAIAEINPDYWVTMDEDAQVWRVESQHQEEGLPIMIIETPSYVQAPHEALRLFGTDGGFDVTALQPSQADWHVEWTAGEIGTNVPGDEGETGASGPSYWQDVHAVAPLPEAETAAATLAKLMAHLGLGTCVEHGERFRHLGEPEELLREEWRS